MIWKSIVARCLFRMPSNARSIEQTKRFLSFHFIFCMCAVNVAQRRNRYGGTEDAQHAADCSRTSAEWQLAKAEFTFKCEVGSNKTARESRHRRTVCPFSLSNGLIVIINCIIFFSCRCCHSSFIYAGEIAANYYYTYSVHHEEPFNLFLSAAAAAVVIVAVVGAAFVRDCGQKQTRCRLSIFRYVYLYTILPFISRPCKPHRDCVIKHISKTAAVHPTGSFACGILNLHWIRISAPNFIVEENP